MMTTTTTFDREIPMMIRVMENALRSGYSVKQAFETLAKDLPGAVGDEAERVVSELESGVAFPDALDHLLGRVPSPDLDLIIATMRVQLEIGGNLADKLQLIGQIMSKRRLSSHD